MSAWKPVLLMTCLLLSTAVAGAVSFGVQESTQWDRGSFTNSTSAGDDLEVDTGFDVGAYTSQVFDAGDAYPWDAALIDASLNGGNAVITVTTSDDDFATTEDRVTQSIGNGETSIDLSGFSEARYIRFNYTLHDTVEIHRTNLSLGGETHFLIRQDGCQTGEEELFTLSNDSNAHAAAPGFYPQYQVCASGIDRTSYNRVCAGAETPSLSFFAADATYTHLSTDTDLFNYKLCTGELSIGIREKCPASAKAIVSIYEPPESHIARPGVYDHQLCGGIFRNVTLLMQFHLGNNDSVFLNGQENPSTGVESYGDGRDTASILAENGSVVAGIVSGERTDTAAIAYLEDGEDHVFNVTQFRGDVVSYFIPFTEGDHETVERRQDLIASNDFLNRLNPNFAYRFATEAVIRLSLQLTQVDLVTDAVYTSGIYNFVIQNIGANSDGDPQVIINQTRE